MLSSAPNARMMGSIKITQGNTTTAATSMAIIHTQEKSLRASSGFPSPIFFPAIAAPPVANMMAIPHTPMTRGKQILTAERAFFPTNWETNRPSSTDLKSAIKSDIAIVGKTKRISGQNLNFVAIRLSAAETPVGASWIASN